MILALQVASVFLVSVAMALSLAHALELPGKLRLDRETYYAVQTIYYPGFTFGGFSEGLGILALMILLLLTPIDGAAFMWTLASLGALIAMHATYWILTHPVNKFWLKDQDISKLGSGFFGFDPVNRARSETVWTRLRDRWEYSHVLRALFSTLALLALTIAIAI
jgi:hypothetical protein